MPNKYYESLRVEFFNKIEALKTQNYFEFYKHSPAFEIALNLAYFVLAEEKLIEVEKNNSNITDRYKLNVDPEFIDKLFDGKSFEELVPDITEKEENGNNIWFLSALRNCILHGGIEDINLEDMVININGTHNLNQLKANVPLDFFTSFIDNYINNRPRDNTKINIPLLDCSSKYNYQVEVSSSDGVDDKELISEEIQQIYSDILDVYSGFLSGIESDDPNFKDMIQKMQQLITVRNSKKYYNQIKDIIKEQLDATIKEKYPQYNVSTSVLPNKISTNNLRYKATVSYTDYLSQIESFYENYTDNAKIIAEVLTFLGFEDVKKINSRIVQRQIHKIREENGESFTYDNLLKDELNRHPRYLNDFTKFPGFDFKLAREISYKLYKNFELDQKDFTVDDALQKIKEQNSVFYKRFNEYMKRKGCISDEDMEIYNRICEPNKIDSFLEQSNVNRSKMLVGLLYVFGINMYVINKENNFDNLDDIDDYSFMDKLDIEMYSISAMTELDNLHIKKKSLSKNLTSLTKKYNKNSSNPKFPKEKLAEIQSEIDEINQEIDEIDTKLKTTEVKKFDNKEMAAENNNKRKAAMIRNCLSHNGRIRIIYENNYKGKTAVLLSDSNENGGTAFLKCSIDELFKFLRQDAFRDSMHVKATSDSASKLTITKATENALKQGITTSQVNKANNIEQQKHKENTKEGETKND